MPDTPDNHWQTIQSLEDAMHMFAELQRRARAQGLTLRTPPEAPTTCCGRGCNGCVWEGYYEAVRYWRDEALLMLSD